MKSIPVIKFFRHIRKKLLGEGSTKKYFFYAIGEIVLVVIGILIALQINNSNEGRKDRVYEQKILTEIKNSLEKDLGRTKFLIEGRVTLKEKRIHRIIKTILFNATDHDTIQFQKNLKDIGLTLSFSYDKGPYESLKSIGLDKIKNDSLRSALVRFYEVAMPLRIIFVNHNKDLNEIERRGYYKDLVYYESIKQIKSKSTFSIVKKTDLKTIRNHPSFIKYIELEKSVAANYRIRLEHAVKQFEEIISHINSVLNND